MLRLFASLLLYGSVPEPLRRTRRRSKEVPDYTEEDVRNLPANSPLFAAIAMYHVNGDTAALAAERIREHTRLRILALTQEAPLFARIVAARRLQSDQDLLVELCIRDDEPALAVFAARLVSSASHIGKLQRSKYETVRHIGLLKERDPRAIEKILDDPNPEIRRKARERLREIRAN
ncbi:MAG TPA: hypothetical protein VMU11_00570 [Verrucomicrobiae bacterium]|nr:hypothetical protein [Verrucomicrobiae bacterium]